MTAEEIVRWLRCFKYDPAWRDDRGNRRIPLRNLADYAGVHHAMLYDIIYGKYRHFHEGTVVFARLETAIKEVIAGRIYWRRLPVVGRKVEMVRVIDAGPELRLP